MNFDSRILGKDEQLSPSSRSFRPLQFCEMNSSIFWHAILACSCPTILAIKPPCPAFSSMLASIQPLHCGGSNMSRSCPLNISSIDIDIFYNFMYICQYLVQGEGFEPPKAEPDDLQSPVFDRFTIPALGEILAFLPLVVHPNDKVEPPVGFEPTTHSLQNCCSSH
jgi:hypothetical protein